MKRGILAAAAVIVVVFGGWYFASPSMAMQGLKSAALEGDREDLKERVDFPAVRESLKSQLRAHMMAEMAKEKDSNPFAGLGMMLAGAIIDPMIDGVISPDGIKAMVEHGRMKGPNESSEPASSDEGKQVDWNIERRGFDKFIATPEAEPGERVPSLVFKRDGLGWDLVDIEIPSEGLGNQQPAEGDV